MDELTGRLQEFLTTAPTSLVLLAALLSGVIETVFPPFPSEGLLLMASFTGARRDVSPWALITVSAVGSFLSLYALYLLGRGHFRDAVRKRLKRWIGRAEGTVRDFFGRWGYGAVLVSRFLPGIRGPLTFLAGVYGLNKAPVAAALLTGCFAWNSLVVFLGYRTGRGWDGSSGGLLWAGVGLAGATILLWGIGAGVYRILKPKG